MMKKPVFKTRFDKEFGTASMTVDYGIIYLQANAAIRNAPSEILFASSRQVRAMLAILNNN